MSPSQTLRIRRSIQELQNDYTSGQTEPLEKLWRAWIGMKARPPDDPQSFFVIGGYHGAPNPYCNHGTVLFPPWHRVYLLKLEDALRSVPGCADVTLPYWDETSQDSLLNGIPWALTNPTIVLDGQTIPNPLRSFELSREVVDPATGDGINYTKPSGYETKRYPLSGLVGTEADQQATDAHNANFADVELNNELLNQNIATWLKFPVIVDGVPLNGGRSGRVAKRYVNCLNARDYTTFSNTTSASKWNADHPDPADKVIPLESPHNSIHVAVGGFHFGDKPENHLSPISGANGDMGENDTAAFDPIFYFHHCFIDCVFWLWQRQHNATDSLEIWADYPGTNSNDDGGRPTDTPPDTALTLDSPLNPFTLDGSDRAYTPRDCINSETQLNVTYSPCSLETPVVTEAVEAQSAEQLAHTVSVTGLDRAQISGSFVVAVYGNSPSGRVLLDVEAVLSRSHPDTCANCQSRLKVDTHFAVPAMSLATESGAADPAADYVVEVFTRSDGDGTVGQGLEAVASRYTDFRVEVR